MDTDNTNWMPVKNLMGKSTVRFGQHLSFQFVNTPRRLLYSLSYYKFAAKLIGVEKNVIDIGCGEGLGTWVLAKECGHAVGVDFDKDAIQTARSNWPSSQVRFTDCDFMKIEDACYDAIVAFDVIEHILPVNSPDFFNKVSNNIAHDGLFIVGTPNETSHMYANEVTRKGHINLFSGQRLEEQMREVFHHVFMFGANDEVIHTGFLPMSHYLIAVGCRRRKANQRQ